MRKPIMYWLNQLPDGYRERAIRAFRQRLRRDSDVAHWEIASVYSAVYAATIGGCQRLVEGRHFWRDAYYHYLFRFDPQNNSYVKLPALPTTNIPRLRK